ncbi:MAG: hypothetical protein LBB90_04300 [Tannerella sp.]|jgi:hypothetical protein|nr:hypothetical protein [Tannerella sp.]
MKSNKHVTEVPTALITALESSTDMSIEEIAPYDPGLTPHERSTIPRMGEKTFAFVEKAYDYAKSNPTLCPSFLDMNAFEADYADAHNLWNLRNKAKQFYEIINDIVALSGSEAYQSSLLFYHAVKMAVTQGVPGAKAIYDELRKRFPHVTHKPDPGPVPNTDKAFEDE